MRLFIASPVSLPIYQKIKEDFKDCINGKWVEGWNLHLTHKFIGDDEAEKFEKKLIIPDINIEVEGIGTFKERVLFLKVKQNGIEKINKEINKTFKLTNEKPFKPHITLCRIKEIKDKEKFQKLLKKWQSLKLTLPLTTYLYSSTLTKKGPVYKKIYQY